MNNQSPAQSIISTLSTYRKWWLAPTLICTLLALGYAIFSEKSYTTRQSLVVRDDLVGTSFKPGRFDSLDSMKSNQETILEISRRPEVVRMALKQLGPPSFTSEKAWLGDENIEKMQGRIALSAPNGAEFGQTEAVVLSVKQNTRERSGEFVGYLLEEVQEKLRELRGSQFASMHQELNQAAQIAEQSYLESANQLKSFEQNVGSDLITLISLNDAQQGTNILQGELAALTLEQRQAWADMENVRKQMQVLENIADNPGAILEVPQELLELQPTLASLAAGLNDAVLTYSKSQGRYQNKHPRVREDRRSVADIEKRIIKKLSRTLGSLNSQLELREEKHTRLSQFISEKKSRLGELSSLRVDYTTLRQQVDKKREINAKAQSSLAEVSSLGTSASQVSLISKIGDSQTELYPDGLSKKAIIFGGMIAGLMMGLGLVMFVAPLGDGDSDFSAARTNQTSQASRTAPVRGHQNSNGNGNSPTQQTPDVQTSASSKTHENSISGAIQKEKLERSFSEHGGFSESKSPSPSTAPVATLPESAPSSNSSPSSMPALGLSEDGGGLDSSSPSINSNGSSGISAEAESGYQTKTAAEIAAEITGSISTATLATASPIADSSIDELFELDDIPMDEPSADLTSLIDDAEQATQELLNETEAENSIVQSANSEFEVPVVGQEIKEFKLDQDTLTKLRTGNDDTRNLPEKLTQLEQVEQQIQDLGNDSIPPITTDITSDLADDSQDTTSQPQISSPLTSTSIENSSHLVDGNESAPQTGEQPEDRPTVTTVDLRMLKEQLSGNSKAEPSPRPLSEIVGQSPVENDGTPVESKPVDRSISDLAESIREVCQKKDKPSSS